MRTQRSASRPSTRSGLPSPRSPTTRSTSSTMARTRRSLGADTMTNSSATTSTSPTSSTTMSRPPLASAARAAVKASSRAATRSLLAVSALSPLDQILGVLAEDNGHVDLVVRHPPPILPARRLLDATEVEVGLDPQGERGAVLAQVEDARAVDARGGGVAGEDDLGAARHQRPGRHRRERRVAGPVEEPDADAGTGRGRRGVRHGVRDERVDATDVGPEPLGLAVAVAHDRQGGRRPVASGHAPDEPADAGLDLAGQDVLAPAGHEGQPGVPEALLALDALELGLAVGPGGEERADVLRPQLDPARLPLADRGVDRHLEAA